MGKTEIEYVERVTAEQGAAFLEEIARGLRSGTLELSGGKERVRLQPTNIVKLELEASADGDKQQLMVEMKWRVSEVRVTAEQPGIRVVADLPSAVGDSSMFAG